ncbi:hypothetical protein [Pyrococcus yayanosii]|uniref:hypothetical protein n=1 Tax=Pyrococcus yayanosii TaxID=1008460 RepID=UPI00064EF5A0|nr:hypothetical protein [Pyrococcus yayanosii]
MGLKLLLNMAAYVRDKKALLLLIRELTDLLTSEDILLLDFILTIVMELTEFPPTEETVKELSRTLTAVKNLALYHKDPTITNKAKMVAGALEDLLHKYYVSNPEEALRKINGLLKDGKFEEAIDLALAVGDKYILKWLAGELENMEKVRLQIGERIILGPVYKSPLQEMFGSRELHPPLLGDFKQSEKSKLKEC